MFDNSPICLAVNGTMIGRNPMTKAFRFLDLTISHLPPYSPSLHRVLLHGFITTMRTLTPVGRFIQFMPMSSIRSCDQLRHRAGRAWTLHSGAVPTPLFNDRNCPRPVTDRSPCLSRLNFRPFHPQPPHHHFATINLARYFIVVACRVYPSGLARKPVGPLRTTRVRRMPASSPTGSAESGSFSLRTGLSPRIALHLYSRKRSYLWIQAGNVRLKGTCTPRFKRLHRRTGHHRSA